MKRRSIRLPITSALAGLLAILLLGGCSTDRITAPGPPLASWESLTLLMGAAGDTLAIATDGSLTYRSAEGEAVAGLVSAHRLAALETTLAAAELEELEATDPPPGGGRVRVVSAGRARGFEWATPEQLSAEQEALLERLAALRAFARGEASERVAVLTTEPILAAARAAVLARRARVVRSQDELIDVIRSELGDAVVLLPQIDFEREMLLAVFAGCDVHPGSQVEIGRHVSRTAGGYLQVGVTVYEPPLDCGGQEPVCPAQIVRLPRIETEIFFDWEWVATDCPTESGAAVEAHEHDSGALARCASSRRTRG